MDPPGPFETGYYSNPCGPCSTSHREIKFENTGIGTFGFGKMVEGKLRGRKKGFYLANKLDHMSVALTFATPAL